jgi:lysyl-tRNA synthetase class 2
MPAVTSEHLKHISYDHGSKLLTIEFNRPPGATYQYHDVPQTVYEGLLKAPSHSEFFNKHVKGKYRTHKLR